MLSSLRGTICLYQGEELGLPEADLAFEDLRDPYGIRFWPAFKGRDGCRTPMVWEGTKPAAGFTTGRPWLPVSGEHAALAVDAQEGHDGSVLAHYRETLAFRKAQPLMVDGDLVFANTNADLLVFTRERADDKLLFIFNLTRAPQSFVLPADIADVTPVPLPGFAPPVINGTVELDAMDAFCGRLG